MDQIGAVFFFSEL